MSKEKSYKVVALSVGGNRVYHHGEIVTQANFNGTKVSELESGGFLEEVGKVEKEDTKAEEVNKESDEEVKTVSTSKRKRK